MIRMDLTRDFSVPAGIEEAWTAFNQLGRLEPCLPGLTLTRRAGDQFDGSLKIKFGPIALVYDGSGRYAERDIDARRLVVEAEGQDRRGNGTARVTLTLSFAENGEQTDVEVSSDLAMTGKPAQFGEDVIADTLDKLLDQFVNCVSGRFAEGLGDPAEEDDDPEEESDTEQTIEFGVIPAEEDEDAADAEQDSAPAPATPAIPGSSGDAEPPPARPAPAADAPRPAGPYQYTPPENTSQPDVKVAATIASVLIKRYGPALGVVSLAVVVAVKIIARLRRR